jgi:hypothetical protein
MVRIQNVYSINSQGHHIDTWIGASQKFESSYSLKKKKNQRGRWQKIKERKPFFKSLTSIKNVVRAGGVAQVVEHLPGKCKALSSNPVLGKKCEKKWKVTSISRKVKSQVLTWELCFLLRGLGPISRGGRPLLTPSGLKCCCVALEVWPIGHWSINLRSYCEYDGRVHKEPMSASLSV